jgi:hypothetical protein
MNATRVVVRAAAWLLILALALFVWPTPYRDYPIRGPVFILGARQNRFTQQVEVLLPQGWFPVPAKKRAPTDPLAGYTPNWRDSVSK